jgi:hypothetical protein
MSQLENPEFTRLINAMPQAAAFVLIGVLTAIGQIMQSQEPVTLRVAIGRCITTGGIAVVAGAGLTLFPTMPFIAQIGLAAALASLGNSGLEVLLQKILGRR